MATTTARAPRTRRPAESGIAGTKPERRTAGTGTDGREGARTATVHLPFVTAQFRAPDLHLPEVHAPSREDLGAVVRTARSFLPEPRTVLYFGGLAVMAALEVIEWPVAAAIGVGAVLAPRAERGREDTSAGRRSTAKPTG